MSMRITPISVLCLFVSLVMAIPVKAGPGDDKEPVVNEDVVPGVVIVKFTSGFQIAAGASKTGSEAIDRVLIRYGINHIEKALPMLDRMSAGKRSTLKGLDRLERIHKMTYEGDHHPVHVAAALEGLPGVEYATPKFIHRFSDNAPHRFTQPSPIALGLETPNDPLFTQMTHLPHVQAPEAWDVVKGETGDVVVAIIDGGTDWDHEDLISNIWTNPGEVADNGIDDDENGFVDDIRGWNFTNNSNDPTGLNFTPISRNHGTQVAGVVSAIANNETGVTGVSWNAKIMPVCASTSEEDGGIEFGYEGIVYAMMAGADIINASWGGPFSSEFERDIVQSLVDNDILLVTSAGNTNGTGQDNDEVPAFPANYPGVLSVGSTLKAFDALSSFTHYGMNVDIYAPGLTLNTTNHGGVYGANSGTSFSSPLVAGIAALVKTQNPAITVDELREQIRTTADNIDAINGRPNHIGNIGKGRLNAFRAVTESIPSVRLVDLVPVDANQDGRMVSGEAVTLQAYFTNYLADASNLSFTLESIDDGVIVTTPNATLGNLAKGDTAMVELGIHIRGDAPFNNRASFNIRMAGDGDYIDIDGFDLFINNMTHDTGPLRFTLGSEGNLGWEDFQEEGVEGGFFYLGANWLFEGGLIMGTSANSISDNVRGGPNVTEFDDFSIAPSGNVGLIGGRETFEEGVVEIVDDKAPNPMDVFVRLDSYSDTSTVLQEVVFLKYTIENQSAQDLNDFYAGLFFDWDTGIDPFSDYVFYDGARKMGIFQDDNANPEALIGIKMLAHGGDFSYRSINNSAVNDAIDGFSETEKFNYISGGVQTQEIANADVSNLIGSGPYAMAPGETAEFAIALIGATTREDLEANADAAQDFWDNTLSLLSPNPVDVEEEPALTDTPFRLEAAYPNPFTDQAIIQYQLPDAGQVRIEVYDVLGRQVDVLVDGFRSSGAHSITWDGRDASGQPLANGMYLYRIHAATADGVRSATRNVMLVR